MIRSFGIDYPKLRTSVVIHDVHRVPYVDDARAVRRDLWVRGILQLEDIHFGEPGFCIFFTVLAFNLLGDGLADALIPRLWR